MKEKSDLWNIVALLKKVILYNTIATVVIILAFVGYLIYTSNSEVISTVDTIGVYNLVNSENGEVIATDLTPEDIEKLMEMLNNGKNKSN